MKNYNFMEKWERDVLESSIESDRDRRIAEKSLKLTKYNIDKMLDLHVKSTSMRTKIRNLVKRIERYSYTVGENSILPTPENVIENAKARRRHSN